MSRSPSARAATNERVDWSRTRKAGPKLSGYLESVAEEIEHSEPSLFWERLLPKAREQVLAGHTGRGFRARSGGAAGPLVKDPEYRAAVDLIPQFRHTTAEVAPERFVADKGRWEHLRALVVLQDEGLLAEYEAFLSPLGIASSLQIARYFRYARTIEGLVAEHLGGEPLDVLEIGAGGARLAYFLHRRGLVRTYCVVELPEKVAQAASTTNQWLGDEPMCFNEPPPHGDDPPRPQFCFLTPRHGELAATGRFDLCLNFNSFMEMDERARDDYIALVYRAARPGAVFYNVNRRQRALPQRDGTTFDNNPLLYPYSGSDRVLFWEEDHFQQATRAKVGGRGPSLAVARAAVINEDRPAR